MTDRVQNVKRELVDLPDKDKAAIARDVMRGLDPELRQNYLSEFFSTYETPESLEFRQRMTPESLEYRQRMMLILIGTLLIILGLGALLFTVMSAPEHIEVVGGVITSITTGALGFIGGRASKD